MNRYHNHSSKGSVYLATLFTVTAISSLIFIGYSLRMIINSRTSIITAMTDEQSGVFNAAEFAMEQITADSKWASTAESGVVFGPLALDGAILSGSVLDADTGLLPTSSTTVYRIQVQSVGDLVQSAARFDMESSTVDYLAHLRSIGATHYWPMNEPEKSAVAIDEIGLADGIYQSQLTSGASTNLEGGTVPVFSDTADHLEIPFSADFAQCGGAVSMWMRLDGNQPASTYPVLGMRYKADGVPSLNISIFMNMIYAYVKEDGLYRPLECAKTHRLVDPSIWFHLAVTWGPAGLTIYLDGVQVAQNSSNTDCVASANIADNGEQPLLIGGGYILYPISQPEASFDGSVAHVSWHEEQLTDAEIEELALIRPDLKAFSLVDDSWTRTFFD